MTLFQALDWLTQKLSAVSDSPQAEAYLLLEGLLQTSRSDLLLNRQQGLSDTDIERLRTWLERRLRGEPVQYITGTASFYGVKLIVTPDVLIPRAETERLVERALTLLQGETGPLVLDIGTGSGAVALALKHERPDAKVVGTDVSEEALAVARRNALENGLELSFLASDLLSNPEVEALAKRASLLVANLPYLPESDREHVQPELAAEPELALYSGADGLSCFQRLENQAFSLLSSGASCLLELDPRNVRRAASYAGRWHSAEVFRDLVGRERFLKLVR